LQQQFYILALVRKDYKWNWLYCNWFDKPINTQSSPKGKQRVSNG